MNTPTTATSAPIVPPARKDGSNPTLKEMN